MRHSFIRYIFLAILILQLPAQAQHSEPLFVITVNGKRGFIDQKGSIRIQPQFEGVGNFYDGRAVFETHEDEYKQGYIDEEGQIVIPPRFDMAMNFSEGLAAVGFGEFTLHWGGDHHWGFIDKQGALVIPAKYREVKGFSEGLAPVKNDKGYWGYIDKEGNVAIPFSFGYAWGFSEGLACVMVGDKYGFIDLTGKISIEPQFTSPGSFRQGVEQVRKGGRTIMPYGGVGSSGEAKDYQVVYVDHFGKVLLQLDDSVRNASSFMDGLAAIEVRKDGHDCWGFINMAGDFVIDPQFDQAYSFSEGLAQVCINSTWGFIDRTGELKFSTVYRVTEGFRNGLARIEVDEMNGDERTGTRSGYIDRSGEVVWIPTR